MRSSWGGSATWTTLFKLAREILTAATGRGLGDDDFAALIEVLENAAGTRL